MEYISEILTKEEEAKWVNVDQQNSAIAFIILQGIPTLVSLSKPKCSVMSNTVAQKESVSLSQYLLKWPLLPAPGKALLALTHSLPCPGPARAHTRSMRKTPFLSRFAIICHVPVQESQQNKTYSYPSVFTLPEINLDREIHIQGYPMLWIHGPLWLRCTASSWHRFSCLTKQFF